MAKPITRGRLPSTIESALSARDKVGLQDFVLLHDHTSENEFIENLKKRFSNDLIYVSGVRRRGCVTAYVFGERASRGLFQLERPFICGSLSFWPLDCILSLRATQCCLHSAD